MTETEWWASAKVLAYCYPLNFKLKDTDAMEVWFQLLEDLPGDRVLAAVKYMTQNQRAFPSIADIRNLAEDRGDDALTLWGEALKNAHSALWPPFYANESHPVKWSDPVIPAAVQAIGGFQSLREMTNDQMPSWRARFVEAVNSLRAAAKFRETQATIGDVRALRVIEGLEAVAQIGRPMPEIRRADG